MVPADRQAKPRPILAALAIALAASVATVVHAEVPPAIEPEYAEAILAYRDGEYSKSLRILNGLIQAHPDLPELLGLKALGLAASHEPEEALRADQRAAELSSGPGASPRDSAPFHFQMGVMKFKEKRFTEARTEFQAAEAGAYSLGPTNYLLGMIAFSEQDWGEARERFSRTVRATGEELKPSAYFYLGRALAALG
ncbi:MAG: tetratricopeptide repeat protein, partial [Bdellovibrionota bacterium]